MDTKLTKQNKPSIILMCHNAIGCSLRKEGSCPVQTKAYDRILKTEDCYNGLWIPARFQSVAKKKGSESVDRKAATKAYLEEYGCLS